HNLIERACLLADGDVLLPEHFPDVHPDASVPPAAFPASVVPLAQAEREYLQSVVARFQGSRSELAAVLGLSPRTLFRKLEGLRRHPVGGPAAHAAGRAGKTVASYVSEHRGAAGWNVPGVN
ncbi:MAG: helix-turn-helix domain-containing protein, partial [Rhodospirillaceae bacterium]